MSEIALKAAGVEYVGWKNVRCQQGLQHLCGSFSFQSSDRETLTNHTIRTEHPTGVSNWWQLRMEDEAEILADGVSIMKGWIEEFPADYTDETHNVYVAGRDKLCDLVDCSYIDRPLQWFNKEVGRIVADMCKPYSIDIAATRSVVDQVNTKVSEFKASEGDTVFDQISRLLRGHGLMAVSFGDDRLTLTRAGSSMADDALVLGDNVARAQSRHSNRDRYSLYVVKGQGVGSDDIDDEDMEEEVISPAWKVRDARLRRYRPLTVFSDTASTPKMCERRADFEARQRAGASREITYTVSSWLQSNGRKWPLGGKVDIKDHIMRLEARWIISALDYNFDDASGTSLRITVSHPDRYRLLDEGGSAGEIRTGFDE